MPARIPDDRARSRMEAAGVEALERYPGAHKPWRCRCLTCGEVVEPSYSNVVNNGQGPCKHCSREAAGLKRRVPPEEARKVARNAGVEPLERYTGAHSA